MKTDKKYIRRRAAVGIAGLAVLAVAYLGLKPNNTKAENDPVKTLPVTEEVQVNKSDEPDNALERKLYKMYQEAKKDSAEYEIFYNTLAGYVSQEIMQNPEEANRFLEASYKSLKANNSSLSLENKKNFIEGTKRMVDQEPELIGCIVTSPQAQNYCNKMTLNYLKEKAEGVPKSVVKFFEEKVIPTADKVF